MRRAALVVGSILWFAGCVTDGSNGIAPGADGGPCLSNNTCNAGLTCTLQGGTGVCGPAAGDAGTDSGGDAAPDAAPDAGCAPCVFGSGVLGACCLR